MSEYSLDEPGFAPPVPPVPPSSSESSVETPVDGRLTDIHFVLLVVGLIVIVITVARSAWSGQRRK